MRARIFLRGFSPGITGNRHAPPSHRPRERRPATSLRTAGGSLAPVNFQPDQPAGQIAPSVDDGVLHRDAVRRRCVIRRGRNGDPIRRIPLRPSNGSEGSDGFIADRMVFRGRTLLRGRVVLRGGVLGRFLVLRASEVTSRTSTTRSTGTTLVLRGRGLLEDEYYEEYYEEESAYETGTTRRDLRGRVVHRGRIRPTRTG